MWWPVNPYPFALDCLPRDLTENEFNYYVRESDRGTANPLGSPAGVSDERPLEHAFERNDRMREHEFFGAGLFVDSRSKRRSERSNRSLDAKEIPPLIFVAVKTDMELRVETRALICYDPSRDRSAVELCKLGKSVCQFPLVSPDGTTLCYLEISTEQDEEGFIVLRQIDPNCVSEPSRICSVGKRGAYSPVWDPLSKKIYFSAQYDDPTRGGGSIYMIDLVESAPADPVRIIGRPGQAFEKPHLSKCGQYICFTHFPGHSNAHKMELWSALLDDSGRLAHRPQRLSSDALTDDFCCWAPKGLTIFRSVGAPKHVALVKIDADGTGQEYAWSPVRTEGFQTNWFSLSESGLFACVGRTETETSVIRIVDLEGGLEKVLTPADTAPEYDSLEWPSFVDAWN